ncbi:MAG: class I fructose-bisphosphate aldolase [Alphaproteobacteria bacterium]|nr:class I fructose-bisphosphate aldolase [Alphaproteobacteria bacterium]
MRITQRVKKILGFYESDNPGSKANLAKFLMHGKLAGSGKLMVLAVDQGFEHGPDRSFASNPDALHPHFHYQMAVDAGLSGYAAPLGWLEAGADTFAGAVPTILKMNSSNCLLGKNNTPDQAVTATVQDALRLGCSAIGFTIYPGSDASLDMFEEIRELSLEAKACGLAVIIWSYARGNMSKEGETAIDVISYGAHMAALLGAHIIKVKLPSAHLEIPEAKANYQKHGIKIDTMADRVRHVVDCCFKGRRMVIFSGGESKDTKSVLDDARAIQAGGGYGSIIGRNCFQRPRGEAMDMLKDLAEMYRK